MVSESGAEWFHAFKSVLPPSARLVQLKELPFVFLLSEGVTFRGASPFPSNCPFGLEVGAGSSPTKVYNVDRSLPWILTECDLKPIKELIGDLPGTWDDAPLHDIPEPVIAIRSFATPELQRQASFLVYQNPNYEHEDFFFPHRTELKPTQRLMLIVSSTHTMELGRYRELLWQHGYDGSKLRLREPTEPSLTYPFWERFEQLSEDARRGVVFLDRFKHVYSFEASGNDMRDTQPVSPLWRRIARWFRSGAPNNRLQATPVGAPEPER
jgi:hypothetical protein